MTAGGLFFKQNKSFYCLILRKSKRGPASIKTGSWMDKVIDKALAIANSMLDPSMIAPGNFPCYNEFIVSLVSPQSIQSKEPNLLFLIDRN